MEVSYDNVWGTGIPLGNVDSLNPTKWKSIGILGKILMKIRDSTYESTAPSEQEDEPVSMDVENRQHNPDTD